MSGVKAVPLDVRINERVEVDVVRERSPDFADVAKDVNELLREHESYNHMRATHCWDIEKQCSVCQRAWEPTDLEYEDDPAGTVRCAGCGALITEAKEAQT